MDFFELIEKRYSVRAYQSRPVEAEKRRIGVAVYTFLGLIALLLTMISWSIPIKTPLKSTVSIGLLAGSVLGVILIRIFARRQV